MEPDYARAKTGLGRPEPEPLNALLSQGVSFLRVCQEQLLEIERRINGPRPLAPSEKETPPASAREMGSTVFHVAQDLAARLEALANLI